MLAPIRLILLQKFQPRTGAADGLVSAWGMLLTVPFLAMGIAVADIEAYLCWLLLLVAEVRCVGVTSPAMRAVVSVPQLGARVRHLPVRGRAAAALHGRRHADPLFAHARRRLQPLFHRMGAIPAVRRAILTRAQISDTITSKYQGKYAWFSDGDGLEMALYIPTLVCFIGAMLFFVCSMHLVADRCQARPVRRAASQSLQSCHCTQIPQAQGDGARSEPA